LLDVQ
jgi:hypothetical protein